MVPLVGCNIPPSPLHSLGNTLTAGWFQAWVSFSIIDNSSDTRQIPPVSTTSECITPNSVLCQGTPRNSEERVNTKSFSHTPTCCDGTSHDIRIMQTAGDQLAEGREKPTRTPQLPSLTKYFPRGIKSYTKSTAQSFDFTLSALNERTSAHTVELPTLCRTNWQRANSLTYGTGLTVE
jgi:hypothetical protein